MAQIKIENVRCFVTFPGQKSRQLARKLIINEKPHDTFKTVCLVRAAA